MTYDEMRIPIIKLYDNLIVPVQVALSDRLVTQLKDDISLKIQKTGASGLIMDVSGVDILDSYISRTIHDIGAIARLMGVTTVISGIDPMMAMALVEMGVPLTGLVTELNLEAALERLQGVTDQTEAPHPAPGEDAPEIAE